MNKSLNNLVSVKIPSKEMLSSVEKLNELLGILGPYLIALTPDDRRDLPKMSDGNAPFVDKALQYARTNPELTPAFVKVDELEIDIKAVNELSQLYRLAEKLCVGLNDTIMLSGSEAFVAALAIYKSVKVAASMNVAGAQPIYEDLKRRFEGQGRSNGTTVPTEE
jgi:hypothetical protein